MKPRLRLLAAGLMLAASALAHAFDHTHARWDTLLKQHVRVAAHGNASSVDYTALKKQGAQLRSYLDSLSAVTERDYASWSREDRLAFLINAYNAFTVELVLTAYPDLASIKDLGSLLRSPWKREFFTLLGRKRSLDDVEHGLIRAPGVFDEPRIHVAVVCASIGCPMLRPEAWRADRLPRQLDDAMARFLADRGRNRFDATNGKLYVSRIFDWYGKDFEAGHQGFDALQSLFARYADSLTDTPAEREKIRRGQYRIEFLEYDWRLNDFVLQDG